MDSSRYCSIPTAGPQRCSAGQEPNGPVSVADTAAGLTLNALDVRGRAASLPAPLRGLAGSVEATTATFVNDQALRLVQSPQFPELWVSLNQAVHPALVQLLRGQTPPGDAVAMSNGEVQLNMLVLVPALVERLEQVAPDLLAGQLPAGLSGGSPPSQLQRSLASAVGRLLPPDFGYVTLMQSSSLAAAQRAVQVLDNLAWVLVVAALVSIALTLVLSVDRWRTALWLAVGVVLGMPLAGAGAVCGPGDAGDSTGRARDQWRGSSRDHGGMWECRPVAARGVGGRRSHRGSRLRRWSSSRADEGPARSASGISGSR